MSFLPTNLPGVTFGTTKTPVFNTEVVEGNGGGSRRNPIQVSRVRWRFQLTYEFVYKLLPTGRALRFLPRRSTARRRHFSTATQPIILLLKLNGTFVNDISDGIDVDSVSPACANHVRPGFRTSRCVDRRRGGNVVVWIGYIYRLFWNKCAGEMQDDYAASARAGGPDVSPSHRRRAKP